MRIMIVDDNELMRKEISKSVAFLADTILECYDGEHAVLSCVDFMPDWILMDIKMPVMDGIEATKKIKDCNPGLPVVALTAFALEFDKKRIFESGFNDYLVKPFHRKVLSTMLLKHLNLQ